MDGKTSEDVADPAIEQRREPASLEPRGLGPGPDASLMRLPWLRTALVMIVAVGAIAKVLGVLVMPGMAGIASQGAVVAAEALSSTFAYAFALLTIVLIGAGAYELSRARGIGMVSRGAAIGLSGIVIAVALPSLTHRLHSIPTLGLSIATTLLTVIGAVTALRAAPTRILGAVLGLLAISALVRPASWELTVMAGEQASIGLYGVGKLLASIALVLSALATLLSAAWLGTRSPIRGRLLANGAIVVAFFVTYVAARESADPGTLQMVLHSSLAQSNGLPLPFALTSIGAFLVPATIMLAIASVAQRAAAPAVLGSLAFALLSQGALDVPLQALAMAAAVTWGMLAMADPKSMWSVMMASRAPQRAPQREAE